MENWFAKLPEEARLQTFWDKFSTRQIIEIFLASDIRTVAGVHNGAGSVFNLRFEADNITECLRSLMCRFVSNRRIARDGDGDIEIGSLDDWFEETWPLHTKPVSQLSMIIPDWDLVSFGYRPIFNIQSELFTRTSTQINNRIITAGNINLSANTRKRNNELRTNLTVENTQNKRRTRMDNSSQPDTVALLVSTGTETSLGTEMQNAVGLPGIPVGTEEGGDWNMDIAETGTPTVENDQLDQLQNFLPTVPREPIDLLTPENPIVETRTQIPVATAPIFTIANRRDERRVYGQRIGIDVNAERRDRRSNGASRVVTRNTVRTQSISNSTLDHVYTATRIPESSPRRGTRISVAERSAHYN
jgi:hypothetical protein